MGRRVSDEPFRLERRRQDVASAAAADENLAPTVSCAFEEQYVLAALAREDRRGQSCRARADNGNHFSTSSTGTTRTGPRLAARIGASIFDKSPTTITANLSGWMYWFAARWTSAAVTAFTLPTYSV